MSDPSTESTAWRSLAEKQLAGSRTERPPLPADVESARLLHELKVHQVELESQNEALLEARAELEANNQRLSDLYDFAPIGYFSLSASGRICQLNLMGAQMLGGERARLLNSRFADYVSAGNRQPFEGFLSRVFMGEPVASHEVELSRHGKPPVRVSLSGALSSDHLVCRLAAMDVTEQRQAEMAAQENHEDLFRIFNLSQDFISIANMKGQFIRFNPAFERLLGHTVDELGDRSFLGFVHPDDREASILAMADLRDGKAVLDFVNRYRSYDGSYRWLEWRGVPFRGELICALARDITERKQTEDALRLSEEKFRNIVNSSPLAMYLYQLADDGRLILIGANPAADRETGIQHETLYGRTVEEAFPKLAGTAVPEMYKEVASGNLGTQSFVIRYDDERIAGHFDVRVFRTGPGTIVVAFMDISDRMRQEEALQMAHEKLELKVQQRTAELLERTRQLRALTSELTLAEERERRRIATLIHDELQQTLVAAALNLAMLKSKLADESSAPELDSIESMIRESISMSRSLTAELSPPVLQQCGLATAFKWLRTWAMEKYGLEVELDAEEDIEPGVEMGLLLFRGVQELLFNSVKHSQVKSAALRMWRTLDGGLQVEVSDKGVGFDPAEIRAREGVVGGFGLFNLRERLELLGGRLEVDSHEGYGSRFMLWVPLNPEADIATGIPPFNSAVTSRVEEETPSAGEVGARSCCHRFGKIRVLVADDHSAVREGLVRALQSEPGLEVVGHAENGEQALRLARQLRPHFVVMDINMPQLDGIQATTAIRRELPCVKVLGLSSHADEEHRIAMIRAGAVDLLHKEHSVSQIIATLRGPDEQDGDLSDASVDL